LRTRFKLYKTQIPVIEQAIESAASMLGTDKSRGYRLEMICADFLAGASLTAPPAVGPQVAPPTSSAGNGERWLAICGSRQNPQVHHKQLRSQQGPDDALFSRRLSCRSSTRPVQPFMAAGAQGNQVQID
jgi:hypothetical protein